jgi:biotin operon repressor
MSHPLTRVLALLELLQTQAELTGTQLADRLGTDVRTVRRYTAHLRELGIPVESDRGRYGGYRLARGYRMPPLVLTSDTPAPASTRSPGTSPNATPLHVAARKSERIRASRSSRCPFAGQTPYTATSRPSRR